MKITDVKATYIYIPHLGVAEEFDKLVYAEFSEPVDGPYPDKPGLGLELNPDVVKKYGS